VKVVAVVSAYNEEERIGSTVTALLGLDEIERVIVVDDGSTDRSAINAAAAGANLVINGSNLGKGGSLNRVLENLCFDVVLLVDGDLASHAAEAEKLLASVLCGKADLAIAAFPAPAKKGGFGIAQGIARRGVKQLTDLDMRSPISGQRAMTRAVFDAVSPFRPGFGVEVAMTIDAHMAGFRVIEVETSMSHRETARDLEGFMHRGRQFIDIVRALARQAVAALRSAS